MCTDFNITNIFGTEVLACFGKRDSCKEGDGIKKVPYLDLARGAAILMVINWHIINCHVIQF